MSSAASYSVFVSAHFKIVRTVNFSWRQSVNFRTGFQCTEIRAYSPFRHLCIVEFLCFFVSSSVSSAVRIRAMSWWNFQTCGEVASFVSIFGPMQNSHLCRLGVWKARQIKRNGQRVHRSFEWDQPVEDLFSNVSVTWNCFYQMSALKLSFSFPFRGKRRARIKGVMLWYSSISPQRLTRCCSFIQLTLLTSKAERKSCWYWFPTKLECQ